MKIDSENCFYVGKWLVDPAGGQIQCGQQITRLEPRVMDILILLANHAGQVVTRESIEQTVWAGTVVSYDALTSAMLKLRKAFHDNSKEPQFIETVPKKGYRLVAEVRPVHSDEPIQKSIHPGRPVRPELKYVIVIMLLMAIVAGGLFYIPGEETKEVSFPNSGSKISIAVLPFENLNQDPTQDYFVNGITNDLITDLTKLSNLFVISRDSSFVYKDTGMQIDQIASSLGVRYILNGSVRRDPTRVRINARLTDTETGSHIWAERYDSETRNIFDLQDQITHKIVTALALKLTPAERQSLLQADTSNIAAYEYFLHGTDLFFQYARTSNQESRSFFAKAIELDPRFARAYAMLAWTHTFDFMNGWSEKPEKSLLLGEQYATKAIEIDNTLPVAYFVRGLVYRERGDYTAALIDAVQAVKLDPSYANGHVLHATLLYYDGRPQEGLQKIQMAIRLNPHHPFNYPFHLGQAYFVLKRYPDAINAFETGLKSNPSSERLRVWLAASYAQAGKVDEARWQMEQVMLVNPDISLVRQQQAFPFKDPEDLAHFLAGLRKAGLDR